jgi:exportin-T
MADQSQHVVQIPQAVNIAASQDSSISSDLRQEAIGYLSKVKELSEETWKVRTSILSVIGFFPELSFHFVQACLTLYLQGAGASASNPIGRDGKEKLSHELRVYCLQVVDDVLGNK